MAIAATYRARCDPLVVVTGAKRQPVCRFDSCRSSLNLMKEKIVNIEKFMAAMKFDAETINVVIRRKTNQFLQDNHYHGQLKSCSYVMNVNDVTITFSTRAHADGITQQVTISYEDLYEIVLDNIDDLVFSHLRSVVETKVVHLEKSDVAAMARMFNAGADVVKVQVTPTGIGNKVEVTPFTNGVEGETADVTDYSKW